MPIIILLVVALLPAGLLWAYIWKKDPQKEPTPLLIKAGLYGAGICLPVALFELGVQAVLFGEDGMPTTLFDSTTMAFFVAAIPEESFKLLALWLIVRHNPYFDEHFDGIVYAVCIGLGFGFGIFNCYRFGIVFYYFGIITTTACKHCNYKCSRKQVNGDFWGKSA